MQSKHKSYATKASFAADKRDGKVMLITPDRVVYAGLLGRPLTREFGALTVYVSLHNPFHIKMDGGGWESAGMRVVPPGTPHQITTMDRLIGVIMIEPESVCMDKLPCFLQPTACAEYSPTAVDRARQALASLADGSVPVDSIRTKLDQFLFGETLALRRMEVRMATVVNMIKRQPCDTLGAEDFALLVDLSFSRFLHLFKLEVGTTFRRFRAWKRVRSFLAHVNTQLNLTDIALETGYPDSAHFSRTVRRYWGLTPTDIVAGSRRLVVVMDDGNPIAATH
jgi:AraC-like DNA-binding protein